MSSSLTLGQGLNDKKAYQMTDSRKRMNLCDMFNRLSCRGLLPLHGQSVKIRRAAFTAGALVIC